MTYTLAPSENPAETPAGHALALIARKDAIDAEIKDKAAILAANSCDMNTPLVDHEGFPRADLDIYAVRQARVRIIELRNDHKAVMDEIGKALERVYDPALLTSMSATSTESPPVQTGGEANELQPFGRVDGVAPGSPAAASVSRQLHCELCADSIVLGSSSRRPHHQIR